MTTETNAKRLELIKNNHGLLELHADWLIQQAERVQELETSIKTYALAVEIYSEMPLKEAMEKLTKWAKEEFG